MSDKSKIEWTDASWNPVVGCTKIAAGCKNCYAERMAWRIYCSSKASQWKNPDYMNVIDKNGWTGKVECLKQRLNIPLHWKKPQHIFVCSMSDLFHEKVPFEFIHRVFVRMKGTLRHTYQILTKRPDVLTRFMQWEEERMRAEIDFVLMPLPNVWLGVSCSNQAEADKNIPILLQIPAAVRFVSLEPLLRPVDCAEHLRGGGLAYKILSRHYGADGFDPKGKQPERTKPRLGWVIVGGESGPKRRECKLEWIRSIVNQCKEAGVPVFVKQLHINGKVSKNPEEWPEDLRIREYPNARQT